MKNQLYQIIAVAKPKLIGDLAVVVVTLQNEQGKQKQENITFTDMLSAIEFYNQQNLDTKTNR